jgi:O-antigen/teichoic acid export membrane protein
MDQAEGALTERKNIHWGILLSYLRLLVSIILGVLFPPYLLSKIGIDNNGVYLFASGIFAYCLLLSFGIENAYVRFATLKEKEQGQEGLSKLNGFYLISFFVLGLLMAVSGVLLAFGYKEGLLTFESETASTRETLFWLLLFTSLFGAADFFLSIFTWFVYYKGKFIFEQILYLCIHVFSILASFLFLYFGFNVIAVVIVSSLVTLLFDLIGMAYALRHLKMRFSLPSKDSFWFLAKEIFGFSFFVFLLIAVSQINANTGKIVLGQLVGMSMVTVFGYGLMFYVYEAQIASAISQTFSPKINRLVIQGDEEQVRWLFSKVSTLQLMVLFCIVGGFLSCGSDFLHAWLGKTMSETDLQYVFHLSLAFLFLWVIPLSEQTGMDVLRAKNAHQSVSLLDFAASLLGIAITILFVLYLPKENKVYGPLIGMAFSVLVGKIIIPNVVYAKKTSLPLRRYFYNAVQLGLISVVSGLLSIVLYAFVIALPSEWPFWLSAFIKGTTFLVFFVIGLMALYQKDIVGWIKEEKTLTASDKTDR